MGARPMILALIALCIFLGWVAGVGTVLFLAYFAMRKGIGI